MIKSRMVVERAGHLKEKGVLAGDLDGSRGREAAIAGVGIDLLQEDTLSPSHCDLVSSVIKGMPLDRMFLRLTSNGNGHATTPENAHLDRDANVMAPGLHMDAQLNAACEAARAHKAAKNSKIVAVTCGDGAASLGCWREALTRAGELELPIIFVWHNDPADRQESLIERDDLRSKTTSRNIPAITVDGADAVAVYRVASESIQRARRLRGPTLIECRSGLLPGQANGKQPEWNDPINTMETYLIAKGLFNPDLKRKIAAVFDRELDAATRFLKH
jgi:pyruvate dehydrogenase E1 component alpha subunit